MVSTYRAIEEKMQLHIQNANITKGLENAPFSSILKEQVFSAASNTAESVLHSYLLSTTVRDANILLAIAFYDDKMTDVGSHLLF